MSKTRELFLTKQQMSNRFYLLYRSESDLHVDSLVTCATFSIQIFVLQWFLALMYLNFKISLERLECIS